MLRILFSRILIKICGLVCKRIMVCVNDALPTADMIWDLLISLAIEDDALALKLVENQESTVKPIGDIADIFQTLCVKDSKVLYEDPYVQIGIKAECNIASIPSEVGALTSCHSHVPRKIHVYCKIELATVASLDCDRLYQTTARRMAGKLAWILSKYTAYTDGVVPKY
ncbi:AP-2 complex subunit alpha-1-like protein, partial [Tanacetum coccineum]